MSEQQQEADMLVVEDAPRTPLHRGLRVGADTLRMQFTPRAVVLTERRRPKTFGTASDGSFPRYMGSLAFERSRLTAVNEDHLAMLLAHAPLADGWTGRVAVPSQIGPVIGSYSTHDLHMRVAGLDTLTIIGRRRNAWRVELLTGSTPDRWWIDRDSGELLRTIVVRDGVTDDTRLTKVIVKPN
ncbi:MAG: hypothetical protein IBJ03_10270 [Gemmatimonadaceae bacterium]|nr:hypothetical protein [Gemmatimonadaceae bacterium]